MPEIKVKDPHKELIMYANVWFEENQMSYPPEVKDLFGQYLQKHLKYIQSAAEIQAMSAPQLPQGAGPTGLLGRMGFNPAQGATQGTTEGVPGNTYQLGQIAGAR